MSLISSSFDGTTLVIHLGETVDTKNARAVEGEIEAACAGREGAPVVLDCARLEYISSAGLRVLLRLLKGGRDVSARNVSTEVYEIFDMTGFTMMMDVKKAYREVSVEGCRIIGQGAKGVLYRLDAETVCKVYRDPDSLDDILRERELARAAFVSGIPTAISFDVVRVDESYGSVFELLEADTMGDLLAHGAWDVERVSDAMADLLRQMSETKVFGCELPSARDEAIAWMALLTGVLPEGTFSRLETLVRALPDDDTMVHGDFHMGNVMVQGDEPLLIDMDTLSHGNAVFDLESAFSAYVGRGLLDRKNVERYLGISYELSCRLWDLTFAKRFPYASDDERSAILDRIRLLSSVRLMGRPLRHKGIDERLSRKTFETYGPIVEELAFRVDTLAI